MWREALVEQLVGRVDLVAAYLFGSQARGTARRDSDVGVGIWLRQRPTRLLDGAFDLAGDLAARIGKPVDVMVMNSAPSDVVHRILRDGQLPRRARPEPADPVRGQRAQRLLRPFPDPRRVSPRPVGEARMTDLDLVEKRLPFIGTCVI